MKTVQGFTLIELLITIVIIGILAGIVSMSFVNPPKLARDAGRKSDLAQYRTALEAFANKGSTGGLFPSTGGANNALGNFCPDLGMGDNCPEDPRTPDYNYGYNSNGSGVADDATQYVLTARLESATNMIWVVCSTGQSGKIASSTGISGGTCPAGLTP